MMKNIPLAIIFGLSLGISSLNAQKKGDSFASAKSKKSANIVYVHASVNGFANENSNGNTKGLLVDLMREFENYVQETHGIVISSSYVPAPSKDFSAYIQEVRRSSGGVFGLSNTSVKEERKKFLKYSTSFLNNISVLISHKSFPTLNSIDDMSSSFASKTAFGVPSTTNYDRLVSAKESDFSRMKITDVTSSKDILENISSNNNGFGFSDIHYYLEYLEQGKAVKRHPVGDKTGDEFGIVMPINSDWDQVLNAFLSDFLKTAQYREMVVRNLGRGALRMMTR